jgi:TolB-like protein/Tfp pilus assembly protein PilF
MTEPLLTSQEISHYRLLELLGQGAMGEVWLAEDLELPRKVAVKLLPAHLAADRTATERLLREARTAASVDHPGVVTVYEAGVVGQRPYLVMQRVEGETLDQRLERGPLPPGDAIEMGAQIADALAEVHALGIVHRDLKPANIILTPRGPKILDFGIASARDTARLTETTAIAGTPAYMSPEQLRGQVPDNRSDLWSLGVVLYQALTDELPFAGDRFEVVANAILNDTPAAASSKRRVIPAELDFILAKLLRKDPAHRYARAEDLLSDLRSLEGGAASTASAPARPAMPSVAVLYFEVMSGDEDDADLAAGLTEDLIVDLTRVQSLRVAARGEVKPYRERSVPPRTLGRELGVEYVVHGSVRRAGQRARISAQLVRATDGATLWAERFDRTLEDLFEVQAEVSKRIVDALALALKPGEREMLDRVPTKSPEAYRFYLRALDLMDSQRRDSNLRAEELLLEAVRRDPEFAVAHAVLGLTYVTRGLAWWQGLECADQAEQAARKALELEPDLFEAHLVLAMVHRLRGEHELLLKALDRVLALDPDNAQALIWAGWSYLALGKPEQGLGYLEHAIRRHPDNYRSYGFMENSLEMLGRIEERDRYRQLGYEVTLREVERHPDNAHAVSMLAGRAADHAEAERAIQLAQRAIAMTPEDNQIRYNVACVFARLGRLDEALEGLKLATQRVPSYIADWPKYDPDLAALRDHPEFVKMFGHA